MRCAVALAHRSGDPGTHRLTRGDAGRGVNGLCPTSSPFLAPTLAAARRPAISCTSTHLSSPLKTPRDFLSSAYTYLSLFPPNESPLDDHSRADLGVALHGSRCSLRHVLARPFCRAHVWSLSWLPLCA